MPDHRATHDIIRSRFKTLIEIGQSVTTVYDNDPSGISVPDEDLFVVLSIVPGDSDLSSFGDPGNNREVSVGNAIANISYVLGKGDKIPLDLADTIKSSFRRITVSEVTFLTPSINVLGRVNDRWEISVSIPYFTDDFA